jgi:hypothetical protein
LQVVGIVIQGDLSEKDFIFSFGKERVFSLWHVWRSWAFSLELDASIIFLLRVVYWGTSLHLPKSWYLLLGVGIGL